MTNNYVGAGILNIITESLYDNPIVVFREYVQNSMDSILKEVCQDSFEIKIFYSNNALFFLDNGRGIEPKIFHDEMKKIGDSSKKKQRNMGYKGIGRLSGVPYSQKLSFINIYDYADKKVQLFTIDGVLYGQLKDTEEDKGMSFSELMDRIGTFDENVNLEDLIFVNEILDKYKEMLERTNTGFLVVLEDISVVLKNIIENDEFLTNLQWLLPVDFEEELYHSEIHELFEELTNKDKEKLPLIKCCKIYFNDAPIFRPIKKEMFRKYVCKSNFKYAIGFHTFNGDKIAIDRNNLFNGIRIYIDNMLLCTEDELLRSLDNYGLLAHTLNGQVQSVRGIGAIIYITDKINISANARRTFIEVTDNDSLEFLRLLAEFVNTIYDTRYDLSNYASARARQEKDKEKDKEKIQVLKNKALENLRKLAKENVELTNDKVDESSFDKMTDSEKKRTIKKKIMGCMDQSLKLYISKLTNLNLDNAYENFLKWLTKNH